MRVVALGGGKGLERVVKALRDLKSQGKLNFEAVVTVTDNGGSTGLLRKKFGIPAVGDLRRVMDALAKDEGIGRAMERRDAMGHPPGNLVLAELTRSFGVVRAAEIYGKMVKAVAKVHPQLANSCDLVAISNGRLIWGEERVAESKRIDKIWIEPEPKVNKKAVSAIKRADFIILGPGSFFTSILPHLLVEEEREVLQRKPVIFILPIANTERSTEDFKLSDYLRWLDRYGLLPARILANYPPVLDGGITIDRKIDTLEVVEVAENSYFHDSKKLGEALWKVLSASI